MSEHEHTEPEPDERAEDASEPDEPVEVPEPDEGEDAPPTT